MILELVMMHVTGLAALNNAAANVEMELRCNSAQHPLVHGTPSNVWHTRLRLVTVVLCAPDNRAGICSPDCNGPVQRGGWLFGRSAARHHDASAVPDSHGRPGVRRAALQAAVRSVPSPQPPARFATPQP